MSTMSSSPRKHRTTGSSSALVAPLAAVLVLLALAGCRRGVDGVLVTYLSEHGSSLRYPASWRIGQAREGGALYRYLVPPVPAGQKPALSVTFLAAPTTASLDEAARDYLTGQKLGASRAEEREGVPGKSWVFTSTDGATGGRLLLLAPPGRVVGLLARGPAAAIEAQSAPLDAIFSSFRLEDPSRYPVHAWKAFGARLGIPDTWRRTQQFSGGDRMLVQFASPPLAVEKGDTVHAALSVTIEKEPPGGVFAYYQATRRQLGENYVVARHEAIAGGFVDVMRTETPLAVSYIKRYYFASGGHACSLSLEAREDVFRDASRWVDLIATTLRLGDQPTAAAPGASR